MKEKEITNYMEDSKRKILSIIQDLNISRMAKEDIIELIKPFNWNKFAAMVIIFPYIDGAEEPLREATNAMLVFNEEVENKKSAFARKVKPLETSFERMKYFYKLKENTISQMCMYLLQKAEIDIRERKNIKTNFDKEIIFNQNKITYNENIHRKDINEITTIKKLENIQYPLQGFWWVG